MPQKSLKILIVENNAVDARMLKAMLSQASVEKFDLHYADSLAKAFQLLKEKLFDVLLLDLNLPDSKGINTLKKVNKKYPDIAIIINTGAYEDNLGLRALSHGAQEYLIKGKYKTYGLLKAIYYAVERKKGQRELLSAYNSLKETQGQLIQIEKMNVVGVLASGVAHEVKNPLATILYGIEYLMQRLNAQDEKLTTTLQAMKESAMRADSIVKELLDFASLTKLVRDPQNLNEIIEKALSLTNILFDKHHIKIIKEWGRLPLIVLDRNRIEQVLIDLILNAVYAMKEGGTLTLRTYTQKLSKGDLKIFNRSGQRFKSGESLVIAELEDVGHGIPENIMDKIFDPFFTTHRGSGGVGLGLSVARNIVRNHAGEIIILNKPQSGVIVKIVFKNRK